MIQLADPYARSRDRPVESVLERHAKVGFPRTPGMADHADHDHHPHDSEYATERTTAPQSDYTVRDVGVGFLVALVGMVIVFVVPLLLS